MAPPRTGSTAKPRPRIGAAAAALWILCAACCLSDTLLLDFERNEGRGDLGWKLSGSVGWEPGFQGESPVFRAAGDSLRIPWGGWLDLERGSLRFRFRPGWDPGGGPGRQASLVSIGEWSAGADKPGYWAVALGPEGKRIVFSGQSESSGQTFLEAQVGLEPGAWHDVLLSWSPSATWLHVDGVRYGPGRGAAQLPPASTCRKYGIHVGNSEGGGEPAMGSIDYLQAYQEPLTGFVQRRDARILRISAGDGTAELSWQGNAEVPKNIWRRRVGHTGWTHLATLARTNRYTDRIPSGADSGHFEYIAGIRRAAISLGRDGPEENRGRVLLAVEEGMASRIRPELDQLRVDLAGDGWVVEEWKAPRHDPKPASRYRARLRSVKDRIRTFRNEDPSALCAALLVGNVVIPYSGLRAEDGHVRPGDDHRGAWPCDAWFGDLDGQWKDSAVSHQNRTHAVASNLPGDGKFDEDNLPSPLEVAVGRIDFSGLGSLERGLDRLRGGRSLEAERLRRYLRRNHEYRMGRARYASRALIGNYLPPSHHSIGEGLALEVACGLFGHLEEGVVEEDCFGAESPALFGFLAGQGGSSSLASGRYHSRDMGRRDSAPQAAFLMLYGSWIADWNLADSFLKASLCGASGTLAAIATTQVPWNLSAMALGDPLARSYLHTANHSPRPPSRSLAVLGDVTLRLHPVAPPQDLAWDRDEEGVALSWREPGEGEEPSAWTVHRGSSQEGPFRRISGDRLLRESRFADPLPSASEPWYAVRRVVRQPAPGGEYLNPSQAAVVRAAP